MRNAWLLAALVVLAFDIAPANVTGADLRSSSPPLKFNCSAARKLAQQGEAAMEAGNHARSVKLWQQAVKAYELCKNPTLDDQVQEEQTLNVLAGQLHTDGYIDRARSVYKTASVKMSALCTKTYEMTLLSRLILGGDVSLYRQEAIGGFPIKPCDEPFPRPSPSP